MSSITVLSPVKVAVPRASRYLAGLFVSLTQWLQRTGSSRAQRQLAADRGAEAAAVRQYAQRFASHDPRFAADLLAAADRHESTE